MQTRAKRVGSWRAWYGRAAALSAIVGTAVLVSATGGCLPPPKDCQAACANVMACQPSYDDSDLQAATLDSCLYACGSNEQLNICFDDCSASDVEVKWRCATRETDCAALDYSCDVY